MAMRRMLWLRLFAVGSASVGIVYAIVWLRDPVSSAWESALLAVNLVQLALMWAADRRARLSAEEAIFARQRLRGLSRGALRRLFNAGAWLDLPAGTRLTEAGQPTEALWHIVRGTVSIEAGGRHLATCGAGRYVGEMSALDGEPASADAVTTGPVRVFRLDLETLERLRLREPVVAAVVEAGIARDMRAKIIAANTGAA